MRHMCINCGNYIIKPSKMDMFMCARCEITLEKRREKDYLVEVM